MTYNAEIMKGRAPEAVWKYFAQISDIPRGSGNTDAISAYLKAWADERGIFCIRDSINNIIMIKEASKGLENCEPLIFQGHMDMVCEKDSSCSKDLRTDHIDLAIEEHDGEEYITAQGTTLGGDDGIAIAYMMALSEADIRHPRLEMVITVDEETGMEGASGIDLSPLKGKMLINLDSEDEGLLAASCAGGVRVSAERIFKTSEVVPKEILDIVFDGFKGGHSGVEINEGHANALISAARVLYTVYEKLPFKLISMSGGNFNNAIPSSCKAVIGADSDNDALMLKSLIEKETKALKGEYEASDPDINVTVAVGQKSCDNTGSNCNENRIYKALTAENMPVFFNAVMNLPNGVIRMSDRVEGLVETSSNLGILKLSDGVCYMETLIRSMIESAKNHVRDRELLHLKLLGFTADAYNDYSGWEYDPDSKVRELMAAAYEDVTGTRPQVVNFHAGLECGFFIRKNPDIDCVSLGPQMYDIHTPNERMSIRSVEEYWRIILRAVEIHIGKK